MSSGVSETEIYNRALTKLGSELISSTSQAVERARVIDNMYASVRDRVLRACPWNFAEKDVTLSADATDPTWEFGSRFLLPADFIMMQKTELTSRYKIRGRYIHSDEETTLKIVYIFRNEDTASYDPLFVEALASLLAYEACEKITQSNTKKDSLMVEYTRNIREAKMRDGYEDDAQEFIEDDWLTARL